MRRCISHGETSTLPARLSEMRARIQRDGDQPFATVAEQLDLLEKLATFGLGRFLILNGGLNGYWTRYMAGMDAACGIKTGINPDGQALPDLERWMLSRSNYAFIIPERMRVAQVVLRRYVCAGATLASVPCGAMDDLLGLGLTIDQNVRLVGVDIDDQSLALARSAAQAAGLSDLVALIRRDAWALEYTHEFDALVCNGLLAYEPDPVRLHQLFCGFVRALKPGGALVMHYPPPRSKRWPDAGDEDRRLHRVLFDHVIQFEVARISENRVRSLLLGAGFADIVVHHDEKKLCPMVEARTLRSSVSHAR